MTPTARRYRRDVRIEAVLKELSIHRGRDHGAVPPPRRRHRTDQVNAWLSSCVALALLGKDITAIDGLGAYLSLKLIAECGDDLSSWPSAKHFTSWLGLAPSNKVSGGKISRHERAGPAAGLRHFCVLPPSPSDAPTPRWAPFIGGSRLHRQGQGGDRHGPQGRSAVLQRRASRNGIRRSRSSSYETRYRTRVVNNLHRRAKAFGFVLQPLEPKAGVAVS